MRAAENDTSEKEVARGAVGLRGAEGGGRAGEGEEGGTALKV